MIAHNPLHGSGRAALPHPDLALCEDAHAAQGIGMTDGRQRQPAMDEAAHAISEMRPFRLRRDSPRWPEPAHMGPKQPQRRGIHGHSVIPDMSTHHRLQLLTQFRDGFAHAPLKFGFHLVQLRLQPFADRLPQHRESSITSLLYADVRKAEKVERLWLPFSTQLPIRSRVRPELQKARFLGMQFQVELPHSLGKLRPKLLGVCLDLKAQDDVLAKRTTMTSPCAHFRRHAWAYRSNT